MITQWRDKRTDMYVDVRNCVLSAGTVNDTRNCIGPDLVTFIVQICMICKGDLCFRFGDFLVKSCKFRYPYLLTLLVQIWMFWDSDQMYFLVQNCRLWIKFITKQNIPAFIINFSSTLKAPSICYAGILRNCDEKQR